MLRFIINDTPNSINVVYLIESPSGRFYIGSTKSLKTRMYYYKGGLTPHQPLLNRSFVKYGVYSHKFYILEENIVFEYLLKRERFWGDVYNVLDPKLGMNCQLPGYDDIKALTSLTTRLKISAAAKRRVRHPFTETHKQNLSKSQSGKKRTPEQIENIRASQTGKIMSLDARLKMSKNSHKAKKVIDIQSGIIYNTITEAAKFINMPPTTLSHQLNKISKNKTNFKFL